MTDIPEEFSFIRYLAAKKNLDDRSLNRHVRETLARHLLETRKTPPLRVLEVGCGIGTMLERLLDWQLLPEAAYTGIDFHPDNIAEARARFRRYAASRGADLSVAAEFEAMDLFDFLAREQGRAAWDLIVAHAFLDLVDLEATLPGLLALLAEGGFFYFTLNFDGATVFEPSIDPDLDRLIETLYHRSMDERRVDGRPAGSSRTGRRLFAHLNAAGATLLAAGSSDWLVFPGADGYPGDEAYFLHFIIHTIQQALTGHPELPEADFRAWVAQRQVQVQRRELIYLAHQLDFFGRV
ncbi:MAG: class I SAM-dependent methyltransferase [Deltaproteobacteria bacterium]|nr:class I SAM-dependent methyltransferase [Deltaproteobacteria bacterium]